MKRFKRGAQFHEEIIQLDEYADEDGYLHLDGQQSFTFCELRFRRPITIGGNDVTIAYCHLKGTGDSAPRPWPLAQDWQLE